MKEKNLNTNETDNIYSNKIKKSNKISYISLLISSISAIAAISSTYIANRIAEYTEEESRPKIILTEFKTTYTDKKVFYSFKLENHGQSAGIINSFTFDTIRINGNGYIRNLKSKLKNRIIHPKGSTQDTIEDNRYITIKDSNIIIDQSKSEPKGIVFYLDYSYYGKKHLTLPLETFTNYNSKWLKK